MSHEESDLELDAFPDWQPVEFKAITYLLTYIADGGRNAVELGNTQDQPRSRVQDGLKSVEKISIRPVEDTVAMVDSAFDEGAQRECGGAQRDCGGAQRDCDRAQRDCDRAQRVCGGAQRDCGGAQRNCGGAQRNCGGARRTVVVVMKPSRTEYLVEPRATVVGAQRDYGGGQRDCAQIHL